MSTKWGNTGYWNQLISSRFRRTKCCIFPKVLVLLTFLSKVCTSENVMLRNIFFSFSLVTIFFPSSLPLLTFNFHLIRFHSDRMSHGMSWIFIITAAITTTTITRIKHYLRRLVPERTLYLLVQRQFIQKQKQQKEQKFLCFQYEEIKMDLQCVTPCKSWLE